MDVQLRVLCDTLCSNSPAVVLFAAIFPPAFNKAVHNKFPISKPFWEHWCEYMKTAWLLYDSMGFKLQKSPFDSHRAMLQKNKG